MLGYFTKTSKQIWRTGPKMGNLTEKQAQRAFGKKIQKNIKPAH